MRWKIEKEQQKKGKPYRCQERRENLPLAAIFVPPLHLTSVTPHSIQLHRDPSSSSSLVSTFASSSLSESPAHEIKMKIHLIMEWLKNIHRIIIIMRVKEMGSILPELCTIASLLGPTTTLPSGSSSSFMYLTISLSFVNVLDCSSL